MGKRNRKDKDHIRRKIRRLQHRLEYQNSSSSDEECYRYGDDHGYTRSTSPQSEPYYDRQDIWDSDQSDPDRLQPHISVPIPSNPGPSSAPDAVLANTVFAVTTPLDVISTAPPGTADNASLSADILEALGDPKGKDEVFGPSIPDEISKRWGRILVDGLTKVQKQEAMERNLIPDNFKLVKAPILNSEISFVLSESVRGRDKLLEKTQNHLGYGIAGLTNLTATLIQGNLEKIDIIKKLSEISQIFLDLHFENTKTRRKLVMSSLNKKFTTVVIDAERDALLFGKNLGEKIKTTKTAERSSFQIKRNDGASGVSLKRYTQGNWRGPPRQQSQRRPRQGGFKPRCPQHQPKRHLPTPNRFPTTSSKTNTKLNKQ